MKRFRVLLVLVLILALVPTATALAKSPLRATTDYVLDTTNTVSDGYLRAWVGSIDIDDNGTIDGEIVWWIELATWEFTGEASHYSMIVQVWETYPGGGLLDCESYVACVLETEERGTTTMPNTTWRANGVVTHADPTSDFAGWEGRRVHERGWFDATASPWAGDSDFRLN